MKKTLSLGIALTALSVLVGEPLVAQSAVAVGVILEIRSPAFLEISQGAPAIPLDPKTDVMRKLYAGQRVRCGSGGGLRIASAAGVREIAPSETWTVLQEEPGLTPEQMKVARALRRYGSPGGTRGIGSPIYSPADGGSVKPAALVIRWAPPKKKGKASLRLETEAGARLWSEEVDAAAGVLDSAAAKSALIEARQRKDAIDVILIMTGPDGQESRASFSLLTPQQEEELAKDLGGWDGVTDPLFRAIGRSYELGRRRLLAEAAGELEAALAIAPESRELIEAAIEANRRTGNDARARELRRRLERPAH